MISTTGFETPWSAKGKSCHFSPLEPPSVLCPRQAPGYINNHRGKGPELDRGDNSTPVEKPWGLWATLGFGALILAAYLLVQVLVGGFFAAIGLQNNQGLDHETLSTTLRTSGFVLASGTTGATALCVALILLFSWLRRGVTVRKYLSLNPVSTKALARWLGLILICAVAWDGLALLLGRDVIPKFMFQVYETAYILPLLWFALVVAAPLFEEMFFRGFLFEGIRYSSLGTAGALILTSLGWAVIHIQYDIYEISVIFILGLVLGAARIRTQSLYTPIAMHGLTNLLATLEVALYLQFWKNGG
jgi:membrane protease YdiL (CAAX protease family)